MTRSPPASSTLPPSFGISAAPWSTIPHADVSAAAVPPEPAANPDAAVYWKVVPLGIAVTVKFPLYPATLTFAIVALSPTIRLLGFAALVIVTVVPLSEADVIGLVGPAQIEARPVAHDVPVGQLGIGLATGMKASVAGLYNSAVFKADCPAGAPEPAGGGVMLKNELPLEPPTISTCPSSAGPLPVISVALG